MMLHSFDRSLQGYILFFNNFIFNTSFINLLVTNTEVLDPTLPHNYMDKQDNKTKDKVTAPHSTVTQVKDGQEGPERLTDSETTAMSLLVIFLCKCM